MSKQREDLRTTHLKVTAFDLECHSGILIEQKSVLSALNFLGPYPHSPQELREDQSQSRGSNRHCLFKPKKASEMKASPSHEQHFGPSESLKKKKRLLLD